MAQGDKGHLVQLQHQLEVMQANLDSTLEDVAGLQVGVGAGAAPRSRPRPASTTASSAWSNLPPAPSLPARGPPPARPRRPPPASRRRGWRTRPPC